MSPTGENDEAAVRPGQAKVLPLDFELHKVREVQNASCGVSDKSLTPLPLQASSFSPFG